jgi:hypothetical protein
MVEIVRLVQTTIGFKMEFVTQSATWESTEMRITNANLALEDVVIAGDLIGMIAA